ncbi:MAG: S41 family peptidase [Leptospiraceae bacterium]|nr:S41 family peptidase [Leptospiraceae bacterium]
MPIRRLCVIILLVPALLWATPVDFDSQDFDKVAELIGPQSDKLAMVHAANQGLSVLPDHWMVAPNALDLSPCEPIYGAVQRRRSIPLQPYSMLQLSDPSYPPRKKSDAWKGLSESGRKTEALRLQKLQSDCSAKFSESWKSLSFTSMDLDRVLGLAQSNCASKEDCISRMYLEAADSLARHSDQNAELIDAIGSAKALAKSQSALRTSGLLLHWQDHRATFVGTDRPEQWPDVDLRAGDLVLQLDAKPFTGRPDQLMELLQTNAKFISLDTFRPSDLRFRTIQWPTRRLAEEEVSLLRWQDSRLLLITIHSFRFGNEFPATIIENRYGALIRNSEPGRLLLDLRSNVGGPLDSAKDCVELFLDPEILYATVAGDKPDKLRTTSIPLVNQDLPLVVLIDANTSGTAELMAAALRDYRNAILIGFPTAGNGAITQQKPLPGTGSQYILRQTLGYLKMGAGYSLSEPLPPDFAFHSETGTLVPLRSSESARPASDTAGPAGPNTGAGNNGKVSVGSSQRRNSYLQLLQKNLKNLRYNSEQPGSPLLQLGIQSLQILVQK